MVLNSSFFLNSCLNISINLPHVRRPCLLRAHGWLLKYQTGFLLTIHLFPFIYIYTYIYNAFFFTFSASHWHALARVQDRSERTKGKMHWGVWDGFSLLNYGRAGKTHSSVATSLYCPTYKWKQHLTSLLLWDILEYSRFPVPCQSLRFPSNFHFEVRSLTFLSNAWRNSVYQYLAYLGGE